MSRLTVLQELTKNADWSDFESDPFGRLYYKDHDDLSVEVLMRIGLQFGRPVRAMISEGYLLRIQRLESYDAYGKYLNKLDSREPNRCLYASMYGTRFWDPMTLFMGAGQQSTIGNQGWSIL